MVSALLVQCCPFSSAGLSQEAFGSPGAHLFCILLWQIVLCLQLKRELSFHAPMKQTISQSSFESSLHRLSCGQEVDMLFLRCCPDVLSAFVSLHCSPLRCVQPFFPRLIPCFSGFFCEFRCNNLLLLWAWILFILFFACQALAWTEFSMPKL